MKMYRDYFPPSESKGGWRYLDHDDDVRRLAGMEPSKFKQVELMQNQMNGGYEFQIAVIRNGYLAWEYCSYNLQQTGTFCIYSCTKSIASLAFGMLFEDSRNAVLPNAVEIGLESSAFDYLPEAYPLSDLCKRDIKIKHLLSMTSGIAGEDMGFYGIPYDCGHGAVEFMFGKSADRYERWASKLVCPPGEKWDYCDPGYGHLAVIFKNATGRQMHEYVHERLFVPAGIESAYWDVIGGSGFLGPYTAPGGGLHASARDLARLGYLLLRKGSWAQRQLVDPLWIETATSPSQDLNRAYGYGFWTNRTGVCWPYLPVDTFAMMGHCSNKCYVIPSLDLVVARVGNGPFNWHEPNLISSILSCIIEGGECK